MEILSTKRNRLFYSNGIEECWSAKDSGQQTE